MNEDLALKNLKDIKEIFDRTNIIYWLDWGTLLGAIRDGKIIKWDGDMDLGTLEENWEKIISTLPELRKKGFHVKIVKFRFNDDFIKKFIIIYRFGIHIDLYIYRIRKEYATNAVFNLPLIGKKIYNLFSNILKGLNSSLSANNNKNISKTHSLNIFDKFLFIIYTDIKHILGIILNLLFRERYKFNAIIIPKKYYLKLDQIKFYDMNFNIPSNAEEYIKYHYGNDWRIPNANWNFLKDDGSIFVASSIDIIDNLVKR